MKFNVAAAALLFLVGCGAGGKEEQKTNSARSDQTKAKAEALSLLGKAAKLGQPCDDAIQLFSAAVDAQQPKLLMDAAGATNLACSEAASQIGDLHASPNMGSAPAAALNRILDQFSNGLATRALVGRGVQNAHGLLADIDMPTKDAMRSMKGADEALMADLRQFGQSVGLSAEQLGDVFSKARSPGK